MHIPWILKTFSGFLIWNIPSKFALTLFSKISFICKICYRRQLIKSPKTTSFGKLHFQYDLRVRFLCFHGQKNCHCYVHAFYSSACEHKWAQSLADFTQIETIRKKTYPTISCLKFTFFLVLHQAKQELSGGIPSVSYLWPTTKRIFSFTGKIT